MLVGVGTAGHHHGEILQGGLRVGGEVVGCLVTMPVGEVGSRVRYVSGGAVGVGVGAAGADSKAGSVVLASGGTPEPVVPLGLDVVPAWKGKAGRAAGLALAAIGAPVGGRLEIECSVATGVGLGSSTCDVVAAIRAVCSAYSVQLDAGRVAGLAVEAEGAVDPIMFDGEMVLFAQRQGRVLESFGSWTPRYAVLSIDTDLAGGGIDTLSLPTPQYADADLAAFENMIGRAREAFQRHDSVTLAAIATESATLNQRFVPMRKFWEIRDLAASYHALGVQISHSGTVAGILFDARSICGSDDALVEDVTTRVRSLGVRPRGLFMSGAED
jgi:uncharacterized protein involved in propanediol utilization